MLSSVSPVTNIVTDREKAHNKYVLNEGLNVKANARYKEGFPEGC